MPCPTGMKSVILQGLLWLYLLEFGCIVESLEPGFLDFDNLPDTNFSCVGKVIGGYYADLETSCQMFHVCTIGQLDEPMDIRFLCLNGTVFDQETRVCERIDEVDCSKSEKFYHLNLELYGNTQPPILEESAETDPPPPQVQSSTTSTTTPTPKPSFYTTSKRVTTSRPKTISSHHFPVDTASDIRFNPEEINISLNPESPPTIRTKPVSFQQQNFNENKNKHILVTHTSTYGTEHKQPDPKIPVVTPTITVVTGQSKVSYGVPQSPVVVSNNPQIAYQNTESIVDYDTELPQPNYQYHASVPHFQPTAAEVQAFGEQLYKSSTYRNLYHTTTTPLKLYHSRPTTLRTQNIPKPQQYHYERTEKATRLPQPLSLYSTLRPLTFSSPAPFSSKRHVESKRNTDQQVPRIIISSSASGTVVDPTGRILNYSIGDTHIIGRTPPASYDDYKEDDISLDPFYRDVPKLKAKELQAKRQKRSSEKENSVPEPEPVLKNEQEETDVLKFLLNWYSNYEETTKFPIPLPSSAITEINNELSQPKEINETIRNETISDNSTSSTTERELNLNNFQPDENGTLNVTDMFGRNNETEYEYDDEYNDYDNEALNATEKEAREKEKEERYLQYMKLNERISKIFANDYVDYSGKPLAYLEAFAKSDSLDKTTESDELKHNVTERTVSVTKDDVLDNPLNFTKENEAFLETLEDEYVDDNYEAQIYKETPKEGDELKLSEATKEAVDQPNFEESVPKFDGKKSDKTERIFDENDKNTPKEVDELKSSEAKEEAVDEPNFEENFPKLDGRKSGVSYKNEKIFEKSNSFGVKTYNITTTSVDDDYDSTSSSEATKPTDKSSENDKDYHENIDGSVNLSQDSEAEVAVFDNQTDQNFISSSRPSVIVITTKPTTTTPYEATDNTTPAESTTIISEDLNNKEYTSETEFTTATEKDKLNVDFLDTVNDFPSLKEPAPFKVEENVDSTHDMKSEEITTITYPITSTLITTEEIVTSTQKSDVSTERVEAVLRRTVTRGRTRFGKTYENINPTEYSKIKTNSKAYSKSKSRSTTQKPTKTTITITSLKPIITTTPPKSIIITTPSKPIIITTTSKQTEAVENTTPIKISKADDDINQNIKFNQDALRKMAAQAFSLHKNQELSTENVESVINKALSKSKARFGHSERKSLDTTTTQAIPQSTSEYLEEILTTNAEVNGAPTTEQYLSFPTTEVTTTELPSTYLQKIIEDIEATTKSIATSILLPTTTIDLAITSETESTPLLTSTEILSTTTFKSTEASSRRVNGRGRPFHHTVRPTASRRGHTHRFDVQSKRRYDRRKPEEVTDSGSINSSFVNNNSNVSHINLISTEQQQDTVTTNYHHIPKHREPVFKDKLSPNQDDDVTDPSFSKSANPTLAKASKDELSTTPISKFIKKVKVRKEKMSKSYMFNCFGKKIKQYYSDPRDCRLFHYCTPGFTTTQLLDMKFVCDLGTYFDDEKLTCTKEKPTRCR